ncbi:HAMP domain-containing sensor histidine kinase [Ignavibacteria bacterium 4148-Me]|uniref:sensor histidine kinase n=1 Tax=Rosettibacter primus TaxID=3111523 RepID=UPI00336C1633
MTHNKKNKKEKNLSTKSNKEFLSITSHQLRTPLSTILSSVDLLELYIKKKNTARQLQVLNKIKNSILYLRNVIDNITELYKNETIKPNIQKIDIRKFVNDVIEEIIIEAKEKHLINVHIDDTIKQFNGDEFILKQILVNLFLNSIKFSPEGGQILLSVKKTGNFLNFSIRDEGIGVDEKEIKNLFKPFYRGKNVENIPGFGLGLAIVYKLVKLHKGKIKITSSLNKGTEVNVLIPINEESTYHRRQS